MSNITAAQPIVHYRFTDKELSSFNTFKVPAILLQTQHAYYSVEVDEGSQASKRVKRNEDEDEENRSIFTQLPPLICLRIIDYLEPKDIIRFVSTSKRGWDHDFLRQVANQHIILMSEETQNLFYDLLCNVPTSFFSIRSIYHAKPLKRNNLIKLLVSQPRFTEERVLINQVHFTLRLTMRYLAYQTDVVHNKFFISDVKITQEVGQRQQKIAVKVLSALLAGSSEMKKLELQELIMQMPYGFSFFEGRCFPVLESLNLSRSNIRMDHLKIILKAAPRLVELNLRGCDRLEKGDFTTISDRVRLPSLTKLDLTETAVGEEDFLALRLIAPNFHQQE